MDVLDRWRGALGDGAALVFPSPVTGARQLDPKSLTERAGGGGSTGYRFTVSGSFLRGLVRRRPA